MKNKTNLLAIGVMTTLLLVSMVSAFGVSSPYWEGNPLQMPRGSSTTVNLNIQNMVGSEDVNVKAELVEGSDITALPQEDFEVKAQTSDTLVPLEITMPKEASVGETKTVKVEFKTVSEDAGGISMGTGMTILFDVVATEEVAKDNTVMIVSIILAIIILAIILLVLLKKKKK